MIRPATLSDIPALLEMGRAMHAESPRYRDIGYDETSVREIADKLIPDGLVFVDERHVVVPGLPIYEGSSISGHSVQPGIVGMVAAVLVPHFFNRSAHYIADLLLYVRPTFRGTSAAQDLVRAIEMAGAERGATECVLGVSTEVHPEATSALYERMGYARSGISLRKAL